jgi:hypothetical protein
MKSCVLHAQSHAVNSFDNYRWRGPSLAAYSFFEYCMLVYRRPIQEATSQDCYYDLAHPKYTVEIQRLVKNRSQIRTVSLHGHVSEFQQEEETIQHGHPTTTAIQNDLAEILLACFIPWQQILLLWNENNSVQTDRCSYIWSIVEPTLAPYLRQYARNFHLLQKSREEMMVDMALRAAEANEPDNLEVDADSNYDNPDGKDKNQNPLSLVGSESLIMACHKIVSLWHKEGLQTEQRFPGLNITWSPTFDLQNDHLIPLDICRPSFYESSGIYTYSEDIVQQWESAIKTTAQLRSDTDPDIIHNDFMDPELERIVDDGLQPALYSEMNSTFYEDMRSRLGDNPNASTVLQILICHYPLNQKQYLVTEKIISEALTWKVHPYDSTKRIQTLMYIGGEGGTGKSQIIKTVIAAMTLLHRDQEIMLMAPTGAAADNIGGNTYHTALGMSVGNRSNRKPPRRIQQLWSRKTIIMIDEISMVDLRTLARINERCKMARCLSADSPELFGGVPMVVLMGDFYQFPPVQGLPLWRQPEANREEEIIGLDIWHRFRSVILLDEQMRQAQDLAFQKLLTRTRDSQLTDDDVALLNSKLISDSAIMDSDVTVFIVRLNVLRHSINHLCMVTFAKRHNQKIYLFPGEHSRLPSFYQICLEDIFRQQDEGVAVPAPGLLMYTRGMPCMILANINSALGLVNGSRGTATGLELDPNGKNRIHIIKNLLFNTNCVVVISAEFFTVDEVHVLCTKPPRCIMFRQLKTRKTGFKDLDDDLIPVFPIIRSINVKSCSIRRKQVPMCPAFSLTDYKVQGQTLSNAVLDLKQNSALRGQNSHRRFCSLYVQISRLQSFNGLHILQKIQRSDIECWPHENLRTEMQRLENLQRQTIIDWKRSWSSIDDRL